MLQGGAGGVLGAMSTTDITWRIISADVAQPSELLLVEQAAVVLMTSLFVEEAAAMVLMTHRAVPRLVSFRTTLAARAKIH